MSTTNNNREDNMTNTHTTPLTPQQAQAILTEATIVAETTLAERLDRRVPGEAPLDFEVRSCFTGDGSHATGVITATVGAAWAEINLPSLAIIITGGNGISELTWGQDRDVASLTAEEALNAATLLQRAAETLAIVEDSISGQLAELLDADDDSTD